MKNEEYRLTFFFNATHMVTIDGKSSSKHPHTFEVTCYIQTKGFIAFEFIENKINQILNQLNDQYLNDLSFFQGQNPTLENITRHLCNAIEVNLESIRSDLVRIEVAESPVRTFIIDRCL